MEERKRGKDGKIATGGNLGGVTIGGEVDGALKEDSSSLESLGSFI